MTKSLRRYVVWLMILCSLLVMLAGCKKKAEEEAISEVTEEVVEEITATEESKATSNQETSSQPQTKEESSVAEEPEDPILKDLIHDPNMNPLTGEIEDHDVSGKRPVAFSINNHPEAVPAVGIADVDILFEAIVEGGATRMMAIFQEVPDTDTPIGSIRSLRHSYIDFAISFDAIIVHCGGSDRALNTISREGYADIDAIGGAGSIFYRDPWRDSNMGYVHSLVVTGKEMNAYLAGEPFRTQHEEGYVSPLTFSSNPVVVDGEVLTTVDVFFGDYRHSIFTFDPATNDYTMSEFNKDYIDYATNEPIHFKNIVEIRTDVWEFDGVHQDMTLTGEGEGYFAVNGVFTTITWSREDADSPFVFTYSDGSPVYFGVGKTYIAVVDTTGGVQ